MQYKLYQFIPSLIWNTICFKRGVDWVAIKCKGWPLPYAPY